MPSAGMPPLMRRVLSAKGSQAWTRCKEAESVRARETACSRISRFSAYGLSSDPSNGTEIDLNMAHLP